MAKTPDYTVLKEIEVIGIKSKSILINHPTKRKIVTIGRSCLHSLTDDRLDEYDKKRIPLPVTMGLFRVFTWLAKKEGLIQDEPESTYPSPDHSVESGVVDTYEKFTGDKA